MDTYLLFFINGIKNNLRSNEIAKEFTRIITLTEELLIVNSGDDTESALEKCMQIQRNLLVQDSDQNLRIFIFCGETEPIEQEIHIVHQLMIDYNCFISLNHRSFAQLNNPNKFQFRFFGIFVIGNNENSISLFDFIEDSTDEIQRQKIDSKAVFEDSVLNFYSNRVAQSIAGFHNVLKLFPADSASLKYIERGYQILSTEKGSIII